MRDQNREAAIDSTRQAVHEPRMLRISDLSFSMAGRPLFDGASATIPTGHKVGIVGRNGAGKTTLFRLIKGELSLDGGRIEIPARARIVFVLVTTAPSHRSSPSSSSSCVRSRGRERWRRAVSSSFSVLCRLTKRFHPPRARNGRVAFVWYGVLWYVWRISYVISQIKSKL